MKKAVRTALHKLSRVVSVHKLAHCGGLLCANELLLSVCPRKLVADKASDISVLYLWQSRYLTDHLTIVVDGHKESMPIWTLFQNPYADSALWRTPTWIPTPWLPESARSELLT